MTPSIPKGSSSCALDQNVSSSRLPTRTGYFNENYVSCAIFRVSGVEMHKLS
jgi:hypothetical protein